MSTVKKGILVSAGEWAVHLRPDGKRNFWSRERGAVKEQIRDDLRDDYILKKKGSKRVKKKFRLEYRMRPERVQGWCANHGWHEWKYCWKRYETAEQRDMAMNSMNRKMELFEYRVPENEH